MKSILFIVLVCILSVTFSSSFADAASACNALTTPKGKITFSEVKQLASFYSGLRQTGISEGSYPFTFSLCDPTIAVDGGKVCTPASYVSQGPGSSAGCNVVFPTVLGIGYDATNNKVQFNYSSNSNQLSWQATFNCACDATATTLKIPSGQYVAAQLPSGLITLTFDAASAACCPTAANDDDSGAGGITWGGVFLIIFFVPSGIYFIAMVAWNYKNEKRGKDLLPHPEFWGSLPGLAKDGITFIWSKITGKPWSPSEAGSSSSGAAGEPAGQYTPV